MRLVLDYHQNTKHSFHRFARSLGYLDWAAQPDPFRRYEGASCIPLPAAALRTDVPYSALFTGAVPSAPVDESSVGEFLRCAMGLSAWKQYQSSRWALRVNPSSGNLHPTECYVVWNTRVCHYAPRDHALEVRAEFETGATTGGFGSDVLLVGLASIHWREAWKYGERAFRYCQHDVGHAIGALRLSAALLGWRLTLLDDWSHDELATLLGLDRDGDFAGAEQEEPECLLVASPRRVLPAIDRGELIEAARRARWSGRANVLSRSHVEWPAIDEVALATRKPAAPAAGVSARPTGERGGPADDVARLDVSARQIILQRRSALGFDARSTLPQAAFATMLRRLDPVSPPWDAIEWPAQVHLVLFVHRVDGVVPGLYVYVRERTAVASLRSAMRPDFLWEPVTVNASAGRTDASLFLLVPTDVRFAANRLCCDQDIASDGFFAVAMLARFEDALREYGAWFYRRLFWETGLIGQILYLEAEVAGARATGIGCFFDDPVHEALGLSNFGWQSLYHFSTGIPVDDGRLTNEPGYPGGW